MCQKQFIALNVDVSSWSNWWTKSNLGDRDANLAADCPQLSKCSFSTDRVRLNTSSLVLFSYGDTVLTDLPPKYLLKPKWGLFLSQPTKRHSGRIWNQFSRAGPLKLTTTVSRCLLLACRFKIVPTARHEHMKTMQSNPTIIICITFDFCWTRLTANEHAKRPTESCVTLRMSSTRS